MADFDIFSFSVTLTFPFLLNHLKMTECIENRLPLIFWAFRHTISFYSCFRFGFRYLQLGNIQIYVDCGVGLRWDKRTTVSTCPVPGKRSTPHIFSTLYPAICSGCRSLARLVALQEM